MCDSVLLGPFPYKIVMIKGKPGKVKKKNIYIYICG